MIEETKEREKIKLSSEEIQDIVCTDSDEYDVIEQKTTGHWRHGSKELAIVKRRSDGKFFSIEYRESVKDMEFSDMNDGGEFYEVIPYTETVVKYK
jgi:hypothetical protein